MFDRLKNVDVAAWIPSEIRIWLLPLFMTSFAIFGVALAILVNSLESERSRNLRHAVGTVVQITPGSKPSCPIIRFTDASGMSRQFRGNACAKPPAFSVGDRVAVSYVTGSIDAQMAETEGSGRVGVTLFAALWLVLAAGAAHSAFRRSRKFRLTRGGR